MTTPRPGAGTSPAQRRVIALTLTAFLHLVTAPVLLFVLFLFAYGFEEVTVAGHVVFLVGYVVVAALAGVVVGLICSAAVQLPVVQGIRYGIWSGLALYAAALAVGTVVSMANNDQGSVTADQPQAPFVVLVVVAALLAITFATLTGRTLVHGTRRASV